MIINGTPIILSISNEQSHLTEASCEVTGRAVGRGGWREEPQGQGRVPGLSEGPVSQGDTDPPVESQEHLLGPAPAYLSPADPPLHISPGYSLA